MVNLTLLLLLVHYAAYLIFKPKSNVLGCGIFAWAGKRHTTFDRSKFDVLGIMNETRGVDSCGITIDGEIYIGTGKTKAYRDFIASEERLVPKEIPVVIGHTRWASVAGAHNADNAHPFGFGSTDDGEKYEFIGVHNGTLLNHRDLAPQYKVETTVKDNRGIFKRTKIDSEILLEIIYRSKNFKVLSEYNGAAALVFYNVLEPNVIYCYHGMSKKYSHDKEIEEERPLFYYKEGRNSLYISSQEEGLFAIGGTVDNVFSFDYNTVYKITDGNIAKAETFKLSRLGRTQKSNYGSAATTPSHGYGGYGTAWGAEDYYPYEEAGCQQTCDFDGKEDKKTKGKDVSGEENKGKVIELGAGSVSNIYEEPLVYSANAYRNKVVFNKLRYWKSGETIEGFYTFVDGWGFVELADNMKEAESRFWYYCNSFFLDGRFIVGDEDLTDEEWGRVSMPFVNTDKEEIKNPPIFPFYDGIRLKTVADLDACHRMAKEGRGFDPVGLSICSEHPVIDISCKTRPVLDQKILLNGEKFTGNICPLGAERVYHIMNGNLLTTRLPIKKVIEKVDDLTKVIDKIDEVQKSEERKVFDDFVNDDLIEKEVNKAFMGPYESFPKHKKVLEKFLPNEKAKNAIEIIDTFTAGTYKLVEIENK